MSDFMWELKHQEELAEAKAEVAHARDAVAQQRERIRQLEFSLQRMSLACQAMWELCRSRLGLSEAELLAKISEIDLRDGIKDQQMTPILATCPKCGRTLSTKNPRCIFCGTTIPKPHVFQ